MIDLHCHILPGLDDGARDLDDSVAMARQAQADGIGVVCATPHIRADHDVRIPELKERVAELNAELRQRRVEVRIAVGGEVAEPIVDQLSDDELGAVSLGGSQRWVLLEPAAGPLGDSTEHAVAALLGRGYGTILAHPERHPGPDLRSRLAELARCGTLVQVTAAYLVEEGSAEAMLDLARAGMVHLLGSDAHSSHVGRSVTLSPAADRLARVDWLRPHLDWMLRQAPGRILAGEPAPAPFGPASAV